MNVSEYFSSELFEDDNSSSNFEMENLLNFMRVNAVPLTAEQARGIFLLSEFGMSDLGNYVNAMRANLSSRSDYLKLVNTITLGDRIKGNAKLASIVKAQVTSASAQVPQFDFPKK